MDQPGVMIYFDILDPIQQLTDSEKGQLFNALLQYGKDDIIPQFEGSLAIAWAFIKPRLDRDSAKYREAVLQNTYASFCRELKKRGIAKISRFLWESMTETERDQLLSGDITCPPTTSATKSQTISSDLSVDAEVSTPKNFEPIATEKKLKILDGSLGQGVVNLSDYQIDMLLDKIGLDMFDVYVEKLANFIIKNGPIAKGHYSTILKWWNEDCSA